MMSSLKKNSAPFFEMKSNTSFLWGMLLLCSLLGAKPLQTPADELIKQIKSMQDALPSATIGLCVMQGDKVIAEYNPKTALATASTLKAITTATALLVLGPDFRYQTYIEYTGEIKSGVLGGSLFVRGTGDPTLGAENYQKTLAEMVQKVKDAGIQAITGDIVGDDLAYSRHVTPGTWIWDDIGNYYGAAATALCFNQNSYKLVFKPSQPGGPATVLRTEPPVVDIEFINDMKTGAVGSGDNGYIHGMHFGNTKYLQGTIPAGVREFEIRGALTDPALQLAKMLRDALIQAGVSVSGKYLTARNLEKQPRKPLGEPMLSAPLREIIKETNHKSNNLYAEALYKTIALKTKKIASNDMASKAVIEFWEQKGVDTKGLFIEDGSGLSRYNAVSARQMAHILALMAANEVFVSSLPIAGQSGTLASVCTGEPCAGRIQAKSGFIRRARGYAGYVRTRSGKTLAFAVLVNNYDASYNTLTQYFEKLFNKMVAM